MTGSGTANGTDIDYYTNTAWPIFDTIIPAGDKVYLLNITIIDDSKLEDHELFNITAIPSSLPDNKSYCDMELIIRDNDGNNKLSIYYNIST